MTCFRNCINLILNYLKRANMQLRLSADTCVCFWKTTAISIQHWMQLSNTWCIRGCLKEEPQEWLGLKPVASWHLGCWRGLNGCRMEEASAMAKSTRFLFYSVNGNDPWTIRTLRFWKGLGQIILYWDYLDRPLLVSALNQLESWTVRLRESWKFVGPRSITQEKRLESHAFLAMILSDLPITTWRTFRLSIQDVLWIWIAKWTFQLFLIVVLMPLAGVAINAAVASGTANSDMGLGRLRKLGRMPMFS